TANLIDRLDGQRLALLHYVDELRVDIHVAVAGIGKADRVASRQRFVLVDDDAHARLQLHAWRHGDDEWFLRFVFNFANRDRCKKLPRLGTNILRDQADFLVHTGIAIADFRPGRWDGHGLLRRLLSFG